MHRLWTHTPTLKSLSTFISHKYGQRAIPICHDNAYLSLVSMATPSRQVTSSRQLRTKRSEGCQATLVRNGTTIHEYIVPIGMPDGRRD